MSTMPPHSADIEALEEKHADLVLKLAANIRNGKITDPTSVALATITLLEQVIGSSSSATAFELCATVRAIGRLLTRTLPQQLVAANMVRRVLRAIRDEYRNNDEQSTEYSGSSLQRLVLGTNKRRATLPRATPKLDNLREHIAELRTEVETSSNVLSSSSPDQIHSAELVLTYGASALTERWLKAAQSRKYTLLVVEDAKHKETAAMAARLSAAGISVTLVDSASIFGLMSRVNKVVLEVSSVFAGGAVLTTCGARTVTTAARHFSVPVIALAPLYKLTPLHVCDQNQPISVTAPYNAVPYKSATSVLCHPYSPMYDTIPPDHITLFITNLGGSSPSYIYRLLSELYDANDFEF